MALALFGVAHTSVRVVLRDAKNKKKKKAFDLSPVMLALRSAYFAARYRPGSEWGPCEIEVDDVDVGELVLRQCYGRVATLAEMKRDAIGWSQIVTLFKTQDLFQVDHGLIDDALQLALERLRAAMVDEEDGDLTVMRDLSALRATAVAERPAFIRLMEDAFDRVESPAAVPPDLAVDYRWHHVVGAATVGTARALIEIARDLLEAKDERVGRAHLQHIGRRSVIATSNSNREAVLEILSKIKGDELGGSLILRARDALALRLKGGFKVKRTRGDDPK